MKSILIGMVVIVMAWAGVADAIVTTITDTTVEGNGTNVFDGSFRPDAPDNNYGLLPEYRAYPEVGYPTGKTARQGLFWFDLSSIPAGATINSASLGMYFDRNRSGAPQISGYQLSRFLPGKDWIEGVAYEIIDNVWYPSGPANEGEPTYNSQKHNQVLWDTPGALGATDVDLASSISFDKQYDVSEWKVIDVTSFVTEWVTNGVENNGMLLHGGTYVSGNASRYWNIQQSESDLAAGLRPYLEVNWVPEPVTALLLMAGIPMLRRRRI